jgi:DNA-binding GntR family transcriptional regulator
MTAKAITGADTEQPCEASRGNAESRSGVTAKGIAERLGAYIQEPVRGRTTDYVTSVMREAILDGVLSPSTWLRESELAGAFKLSRTPIREALRLLADEGLAVKTAHHGTVVASLSLEDIVALYVVREYLEGLAARLAAKRCPEGLVEQLDQINERMRAAADQHEGALLARLNLDWHRALRDGAANPYVDRFLTKVDHAVCRLPPTMLVHPGRVDEVLNEHASVAWAVQLRDGEAAERRARTHVRRAREIRLAVHLES